MSWYKPVAVINGQLKEIAITDDIQFKGFKYLDAQTGGANCLFIGDTGNTTNSGASNLFAGKNAGNAVTTGAYNFALGTDALKLITTSANNVAVGDSALKNLTNVLGESVGIGSNAGSDQTGGKSVNIGYKAGQFNGGFCTYIGHSANDTGVGSGQSIGIGAGALKNNTGTNSTAIGYNSGLSNLAGQVTAIGMESAFSNTSATHVTAIGEKALRSNTIGFDNTAVGFRAGYANISSYYNVYLGQECGENGTGEKNTFVGYKAGESASTSSSGVRIGYLAGQSDTTSNKLHIANNATESLIYGDFSSPSLKINGKLEITKAIRTSATETITASSDTLDDTNHIVLCDATSNAITINLPTAVGNNGLTYRIKKTDSSINFVTIDANGSQTIDGDETFALELQHETVDIASNGTNWFIL